VTNGDPRRFREVPERETLALIAAQRTRLSVACDRVGRDISEVSTMVNGSVVGDDPAASPASMLGFARRCADLGFTDLTVHYPRSSGIFAGSGTAFAHTMAEAIPAIHAL
jgi:hypothetical protein